MLGATVLYDPGSDLLKLSSTMDGAIVSGSMLVSTGFNKADYTFNLWPRDGAFTGFAAISDFAPDNANFTATAGVVAVPRLPLSR